MLVALVACSTAESVDEDAAVAAVEQASGLSVRTIEPGRLKGGAAWWADAGFHRVGPPIHLPSAEEDSAQVEVWVRVPDGAPVALVERSDGVSVTDWPVGSEADRVEYRGTGANRRVVDVRGTRLTADGPLDHIYRPLDRDTPGTPLVGYEWPAHDAAQREAATEAMVLRTGRESLRKKMHCVRCHTPLRPDNERPKQHGLVDRGTDAAGWFTPTTVLRDRVPVERYGRHDRNIADPLVTVGCADGRVLQPGEALESACNGVVPFGERDVVAGLKAGDSDTEALCASRSWLATRLVDGLPSADSCTQ